MSLSTLDIFAEFKTDVTRITFSGGLVTPEGSFFNGVWVDFTGYTLYEGQSINIDYDTDNIISVPYTDSVYNTLSLLTEELLTIGVYAQFVPRLYGDTERVDIGKILLPTNNELFTNHVYDAYISEGETIIAAAQINNSPTLSKIQASVLPLRGRDLETMVMPSGLREQDVFRVFTTTRLYIVNNYANPNVYSTYEGNESDKIIYEGVIFSLQTFKPWINSPIMGPVGGVSQYEYLATFYQPLYSSNPELIPIQGELNKTRNFFKVTERKRSK